jgi:peptidoglycan/LPS O-acetylase OafA/YrhL
MTMRSFLAILTGYLVFGISPAVLFQLTHADPHQQSGAAFMIGSTIYGVVFAIAAGYTAARIAGKKELVNAGVVAGIIALLALISIFAQPGLPSYWTQAAAVILMAPAAFLGGWLRVHQAKTKKEKP